MLAGQGHTNIMWMEENNMTYEVKKMKVVNVWGLYMQQLALMEVFNEVDHLLSFLDQQMDKYTENGSGCISWPYNITD